MASRLNLARWVQGLLVGLVLLASHSAALAGECVSSYALEGAIDRLARGEASTVQLPLAADCLSGGYGTSGFTLEVDDKAFPQSDGIKRPARSRTERKRAAVATKALISTIKGNNLVLRIKNRKTLYMTPREIYTFRVELTFKRVLTTSTTATAGELDAAYDSPCVSFIWLWSRDPQFESRRKLSSKDGFGVEFRLLGPRKGRVLDTTMTSPHYATFRWFPDTGGERQRIHVTIKANGTRVYREVDLKNECSNRLVLPPRSGTLLKLKVGYPLVGAGLGYQAEGPHMHFGVSMDYDYYIYDLYKSERMGSHILSFDWRAGPDLTNFAMLASVSGGIALKDNRFSAYYSPRLIFAQRGTSLSLQVGAAMFDGDGRKDLTWLVVVEWAGIFGDGVPGQPVAP